jgi:hypothetical protein
MNKEKNRSLETMSNIEITLLSKKSSTQSYRDKNEDVYNYCKQKGNWARKCEKKKNEYA